MKDPKLWELKVSFWISEPTLGWTIQQRQTIMDQSPTSLWQAGERTGGKTDKRYLKSGAEWKSDSSTADNLETHLSQLLEKLTSSTEFVEVCKDSEAMFSVVGYLYSSEMPYLGYPATIARSMATLNAGIDFDLYLLLEPDVDNNKCNYCQINVSK